MGPTTSLLTTQHTHPIRTAERRVDDPTSPKASATHVASRFINHRSPITNHQSSIINHSTHQNSPPPCPMLRRSTPPSRSSRKQKKPRKPDDHQRSNAATTRSNRERQKGPSSTNILARGVSCPSFVCLVVSVVSGYKREPTCPPCTYIPYGSFPLFSRCPPPSAYQGLSGLAILTQFESLPSKDADL